MSAGLHIQEALQDLSVFGEESLDQNIQRKRVEHKNAKITSVRQLTHNTFELKVECRCPETGELSGFTAQAGQYIVIKVDEIKDPRPYSFVVPPEAEKPGMHTFTIRLEPDGEFSGWLAKGGRIGTPLRLSGPFGYFLLDDSNAPIVCVAGGSGLSSTFCLMQYAAIQKVRRNALFFHGVRKQIDLYYAEEIEKMQKAWAPGFSCEFIPVLSDEEETSSWTGAKGMIATYIKENYLDTGKFDIATCRTYLCGPPSMVTAVEQTFLGLGLAPKYIHFDRFENMRSPAPVVDNSRCILCDECLLVKPVKNCLVEVSQLSRGKDGIVEYQKIDPGKTSGLYYNTLYIDDKTCIRCHACVDVCPVGAISPLNSREPKTLSRMIGLSE